MFVDNLGAMCDSAALSKQMVSEWTEIFETLGLALHKTEEHVGLAEALGTELDGREFSSRVTSKRFWMLRQGLTALLRRGQSSCRALERPIGHHTFMGPASRGTLCTSHNCCRYIPSKTVKSGRKCLLSCGASGSSCWFCLRHGGFFGILACSKVTPACKDGHWHTASGHMRRLLELVEPWKGADFVELVLIQQASQHWYWLCW